MPAAIVTNDADCPPPALDSSPISEREGAFRGVHLLDEKAAVLRRLDRFPRGRAYCGAPQPDGPRLPRPVSVLYLNDSYFVFAGRPSRLRTIGVQGAGLPTAGSIAVGDSLRAVDKAYADRAVDCRDQTDSENVALFSSCIVQIGRYTLFFGHDPITTIELSITPGKQPHNGAAR